jgi:hypothetical protein
MVRKESPKSPLAKVMVLCQFYFIVEGKNISAKKKDKGSCQTPVGLWMMQPGTPSFMYY